MKNVRLEKRSISRTKQRLAMLDEADRPKKDKLVIYLAKGDDRYLIHGSNSDTDLESVRKSEPGTVKVICLDAIQAMKLEKMLNAKNK